MLTRALWLQAAATCPHTCIVFMTSNQRLLVRSAAHFDRVSSRVKMSVRIEDGNVSIFASQRMSLAIDILINHLVALVCVLS